MWSQVRILSSRLVSIKELSDKLSSLFFIAFLNDRTCCHELFDTDSNDAGGYYREEPTHGTTYAGQRNSFLFSMLVMASYIIRADGRIMHSEMEFVRRFLRSTFGEAAVGEGERILLNLFEQRKQMDRQNPLAFRNTIRDCHIHGTIRQGSGIHAQPRQ